MEEVREFFADNGLDLSRLVGPDFEQSLRRKSTCVGSNCGELKKRSEWILNINSMTEFMTKTGFRSYIP